MDQNSSLGGFSPMNNTTPTPAPNPFAAPTMPTPAPQPATAPVSTGMPTPGMATPIAPSAPAVAPAATAGMTDKKNNTLIETIILIAVCVIAAIAIVFAVIFFMQYNELKVNYDSDKNLAVAEAVKKQEDIDKANYAEQEKLPKTSFTGPSDYGSLSFQYPKTWSVYVDSDGTNNSDYKAYFRPAWVDPVSDSASRYALRFQILNRQYTTVQGDYESKVKNGEMTSSVFNADSNKITGIKYEGKIDEGIQGVVVLVKVNDKTAIFQMDAEVYRKDFEELVNGLRRNS